MKEIQILSIRIHWSLVLIVLVALTLFSEQSVLQQVPISPELENLASDTREKQTIAPRLVVKREPLPLDPKSLNETVLLVHVGKAGGSSTRDLMSDADKSCPQFPEDLKCILLRVTHADNDITHIRFNQDAYPKYNHFLVPVRNPVDRLISWFNFEMPPLGDSNPRVMVPNKQNLFDCYQDIDSVMTKGLVSPEENRNLTFCEQHATACLTGAIRCHHHNYYNYEVYTEDLIEWKTCHYQNKTMTAGTNCTSRDIRIDVLRQEHYENDLQRMLELWTGTPGLNVSYLVQHKKNAASRPNARPKYVSPEGVDKLCRAICPELLAYKHVIGYADNLYTEEVQESFDALDERCGFSVEEVCGADFEYRGIKRLRGIVKK